MPGIARNLLNRTITKLKGREYVVDPGVGAAYLGRVVGERAAMKIRGQVAFPTRDSAPFVGRHVTIRARTMIKFGTGVTLADYSLLDAMSTDGITLGSNTSVGRGTRIECTGNLQHLGNGFWAGNGVGLGTDCLYGAAGGITIGDETIIGNYVSMHAENHNMEDVTIPINQQGVNRQGIRIGSGCWIGAKATILDGAIIGDGCVIAAGSVVLAGTYEDRGVFGGVPAKLLKIRGTDNLSQRPPLPDIPRG